MSLVTKAEVDHLKRAHVFEQQALFFRQTAEQSRLAAVREDAIAEQFDRWAAEEREEAAREAAALAERSGR